ncbi:MAG: hypothetical protein GX174_08705 [Lentisphaerae bacterium]|jgi:hypothetical protein|nr:hypothetical protein [Lentisphaerota bacterium]
MNRLVKRYRGCLAALLVALAAMPAGAQAPDPPWRHDEAPLRAVFSLPEGRRFALVELPARPLPDAPLTHAAAYHGDAQRPVRVAAVGSNTVSLLVNADGLPKDALIAVYALTNGPAIKPDTAFADPQPVSVAITKAGANEAPPSWEEMLFMSTRPGALRTRFLLEGLVPVTSAEEGPRKWYQGGWKRPIYVAHVSGRMLVPADGEYRFAVRGRRPTYLLINDRLVLQAATPRKGEEWAVSDPLKLSAGLTGYTVLMLVDRTIPLNLGWIPPGAEAIAQLPQNILLTGAGPVAARIERRGATLHAGADCTVKPGYAFHGCEARFTPVILRSLHAAWEGARDVGCRWLEGNTLLATSPTHHLITTNHTLLAVDLVVSNAQGQTDTARLNVSLPETTGHEYRLATRLFGVPAIAYDDDPVHPEIHLRGTVPDTMPFDLHAWITPREGPEKHYHETVRLHRTWTRLVLPSGTAHDIAAIRWAVIHTGVTLHTGALDFLRQPFAALPGDLDGDYLVVDGTPAVLLPRRASSGQPPPFAGLRAGQQVTLLDGFLTPPGLGSTDNGADFDRAFLADLQIFGARIPSMADRSIRYRRQSFGGLRANLDTRALDRLAPLSQLTLLQPSDIVVIAPEIIGPADGETLDDFERRLAALAGLIRDALPAQVVLMTPPPGLLPQETLQHPAQSNGDPMRPYAEAVLRVADAMGITVADFYTMCHTREATLAVADGAITPDGRRLAAETLARTLVGGR